MFGINSELDEIKMANELTALLAWNGSKDDRYNPREPPLRNWQYMNCANQKLEFTLVNSLDVKHLLEHTMCVSITDSVHEMIKEIGSHS